MNTRVKILKALNEAYPFKLDRDTLLAGVRLDGRPVTESAFESDIQTLCANNFIETSRDAVDTAVVSFKIREAGIRWLESKGINNHGA